ncbi:MAG: hypothetical protein EOP93_05540 [Lysobacteraceae bacterium]|nr:MAG: hypothetical protein EOP93_05540 [Xanthomonadaceae bacterium]
MVRNLLLSCVLLLPASGEAVAAKKASIPPDPAADELMIAAGFLNHHPDLRYRRQALEAHRAGRFSQARTLFEKAAWYADKPSQAMLAEMLWKGEGSAPDPALAYAWMDLAAERQYGSLLVQRERYWKALDESQRRVALEQGEQVYARYGDAVAKPRLANVLRKARNKVVGSRTGFAGTVSVSISLGEVGEVTIPGSKFYDPRYWQPEQYWAWHDQVWDNLSKGVVHVGDAEKVPADPAVKPPRDGENKGD